MFRCVMVLMTTVAVLWHTTVGCCAHHTHAEHACQQPQANHASTSAESQSHSSCCHHKHTDSKGTKTHSQQLAWLVEPSSHSGNVPCQEPLHCAEGSCVFAAPDSSNSLRWENYHWDQVFGLDALSKVPQSYQALHHPPQWMEFPARASSAKLRLHLALGVLLL